jgi:hypothetical protein
LLELFAKKRGMDPLQAETWYRIPVEEIRNSTVHYSSVPNGIYILFLGWKYYF